MKAFVCLTIIFAMAFPSFANSTNSLERFSPHFATDMRIIWHAPTNQLPKSFWIYKRLPSQPFSASVISNAVILASLQDRGFPKPSTNAFYIWSAPNPCGMSFSVFSIQPASTTISFSSTNRSRSTGDVPDDETVTKRAFEYAARFGLDGAHLVPSEVYAKSNADDCGGTLTDGACARGIHLARKMDGVGCFSFGKDNDEVEGFSIELGSGGQIYSFSLVWPNLEPSQNSPTASPQEIIHCIREHRIMVLPYDDELNFFGRIKMLAGTKTLTLTKITPFYGEGIFGEMRTNDEPPQIIAPFAELEAVADFGDSNMIVRLLSPIISSEVNRL